MIMAYGRLAQRVAHCVSAITAAEGAPLRRRTNYQLARSRRLPSVFVASQKMLAALAILPALANCSGGSSDGYAEERHDRSKVPGLIGEQNYSCSDGSKIDVDFLADGLTLNLTHDAHGRFERLKAADTGAAFVGPEVTVALSRGEKLTISRPGRLPIMCERIKSAAGNKLGPP